MPTRKTTTLAVTGAVAAVLLAGCGASGATPPPPPPPDPLHGAPKVQNPITNTAKFEQNPCLLLSEQQADQLNIANSANPNPKAPGGPSCRWGRFGGQSGMIHATFMRKGDGLKFLYQNRDTYQTFREYPDVEGYPAVTATSGNPEKDGQCSIDVGITDDRFLEIQTSLNKYDKSIDSSDPCGRAKSVATDVMQTLKKG